MSKKWTDNQLKAILARERDVCVCAGAGSGKTGVLVERFIRIVSERLASVDEILVITFTEKATKEMKERIVQALSAAGLHEERREVEAAYISTIHGFCSRLLKENPFDAGVDPGFTVLGDTESRRLVGAAVEQAVEEAYANKDEAITELVAAVQNERMFGADVGDPLAALTDSVRSVLGRLRGSGWRLESLEKHLAGGNVAGKGPVLSVLNSLLADLQSSARALKEFGAGVMGNLETVRRELLRQIEELAPLRDDSSWADVVEITGGFQEIKRGAQKGLRARGNGSQNEMLAQQEMGRIKIVTEAAVFLKDLSAEKEEECEILCGRFWSLLASVWRHYDAAKRRQSALDNDDLQSEAVHLLQTSAGVGRRYGRRFKFIMVDEFQDTNPLQMQLINLLHGEIGRENPACATNNLFVVGDVQQSIYGFRNADATIFQGIERSFRSAKVGEYISLAENFRSRPEVIGLVNYLFGQMWQGTSTPFTPLEFGVEFSAKPAPSIEFLLTKDVGRPQYIEMEADAIAARIRQIVTSGSLRITDPRHKRFGEPIGYQDISVLLRVLTNIEQYEKAFIRQDIPYFIVGGGRGYYARHEVRDIMNVLTVINMPLNDIALTATLRSPMVGLDTDTLFAISRLARQEGKRSPLYFAIPRFLESMPDTDSERNALESFYKEIEKLRREAQRISVGHLLEKILAATDYDARLLVRPNGKRRLANVRKLLQMAYASPGQGVGEFIQSLREIEKISEREGDAPTEEEAADVVRLITIHKAKGLEFPVVFLADMSRSLGFPERNLFTCDPKTLSLGCKLGEYKSAAYRAIQESQSARELEESVRLLYVALTRAREHLVLCASAGGSRRGENWADMALPHLGITMPEGEETRIGPGGITMKLWPMDLGARI